MNFRLIAQYILSLIFPPNPPGGASIADKDIIETAKKAHQAAHYLFTDPKGHQPGDYPGHLSGALSDSFTTLVYKENQRWKMEMGFSFSEFFDGQASGQYRRIRIGNKQYATRAPYDYASVLKERGYRGPGDAMADVGYSPSAGSEDSWFIQKHGVPIMFQGGVAK